VLLQLVSVFKRPSSGNNYDRNNYDYWNCFDHNYCLMMVAWRPKHVAIIKIWIWISIDWLYNHIVVLTEISPLFLILPKVLSRRFSGNFIQKITQSSVNIAMSQNIVSDVQADPKANLALVLPGTLKCQFKTAWQVCTMSRLIIAFWDVTSCSSVRI
jgi:hypothetical protein